MFKAVIFTFVVILMFSGCGQKWTSKKLPTKQYGDKVITISDQNSNKRLSYIKSDKKPLSYDQYHISFIPQDSKVRESLKLREIRYKKGKKYYKYGKFHSKDINEYFVYTSDLSNSSFKYDKKNNNTLIFRPYCSSKNETRDCNTKYEKYSFNVYTDGRDKYRKYKSSFKSIFENKIFNEFGGLGISYYKTKNGQFIVRNVFKGYGAYKAGMKKGDILYSIDNTLLTKELAIDEEANLLRGDIGSEVSVVVLRKNKKVTLNITRSKLLSLNWKKTLHQNVFDFNKEHKIFPVNKTVLSVDTKKVLSHDIQIHNLPSWLGTKTKVNKKTKKVEISLIMKAIDGSFFKEHPKKFGIEKEYWHLIPKYLKKDKLDLKVTIKGSQEYQRFSVAYYHLPGIYKEIKRLKALGYGYIKFTSNQEKVDIFINNLKRGTITKKKPFVAKLVEGQHTVLAKKYLFGSKSIQIKVEADDAFAYHFDLKPSGNMYEAVGSGKIVQSTGELVVLSSRNDLEVDIDGAVRIPPFKLPNMATGKYKIKVVGPGIKKYINIEVIPNKKNVINLDNRL